MSVTRGLTLVDPTQSLADARSSGLCDMDAERAVLAAALLDGDNALGVWQRLTAIVSAEHFHDSRHALLWEVFASVHARGEPLDVVTAVAELRTRERYNTIGGAQYVGEITEYIPTPAHCEAHARIVVRAAMRRRIGTIAMRLAAAAADPARDIERVRDLAVEALRGVAFGTAIASSASDLVTAMWQGIEDGVAGRGVTPLPFGVDALDRMSTGGMIRGGAYFLAARPGVGKTALACQVSGATAERGERVLYVALEPSKLNVIQSITANRAGVALTKITRAHHLLSQDDVDAIGAVANRVASWPLHVVDVTERSCPDTVAKVEAVMRALPSMPSLVVVDHLLKLSAVGRYDKPHVGTAEVVSALVSLGKRTGAAVLVLCHIGRGMSGSAGLYRRPRAEDIAGGDAMNRDADGIIILHREDKYPTCKESVDNPLVAGHVDLLAPKLRGVEDNTFGRLRYRGEVQRFEAFAPSSGAGDPAGDWGSDS